MPQDQDDTKGADAMKQAPTPGPLSGDDELIERGLRSIRTYDAVRSLRDALTATTARLTGYDWNADPDEITKQQGDAFSAADRVFSDLDAAVAAHPDIDLPECDACNGTGKIEEPARMEGANQHSACVRSCDECDGCGFAPDESLAPTAPVEASGSERECEPTEAMIQEGLKVDFDNEDERATIINVWQAMNALRPQPSGETRPGGYLVKDFADGWYWTPNAAIECATGSPVWSVQNARYETKAEARADRLADGMPNLSFVIGWLANGCSPKHAVDELRILQARIDAALQQEPTTPSTTLKGADQ